MSSHNTSTFTTCDTFFFPVTLSSIVRSQTQVTKTDDKAKEEKCKFRVAREDRKDKKGYSPSLLFSVGG